VKMRLAGLQPDSIVDGPGIRFTVFFQGCSHRCPGCHNPETHDPAGGSLVELDQLIAQINCSRAVDGVTFSGGEPFEQTPVAAALAAEVLKLGLDLVIYSGYTFEELITKSLSDQSTGNLLQAGRLLVDGPFVLAEKDLNLAYRGSRNQRLIDLPRSLNTGKAVLYSLSDQSGSCANGKSG
jgi:anaerobic ribonucleoside-triphosphate reductase activating protein